MILPPDFEARTLEVVRRCTDDIAECYQAEIAMVWLGPNPAVRFSFGDPILRSRETLTIGLVAESKKHPLAEGQLISTAQLERHVRPWVEEYLKLNGIEYKGKVVTDACL